MLVEKKNISNNFLESIISFNKKPIFGKSQFEIITAGIEVFNHVPGICCAALFLLEEKDFNFSYKTSTTPLKEKEIKRIFGELINEGGITQVLNTGEITKWQLACEDYEYSQQLIIPLIRQSGIIGLIILLLEQQISEQLILDLCGVHSNYFASLLNNFDLAEEVENLNEITEQKIAFKTKDVVQSTRELKAILDSVQAGIIIIDKKTDQITDLNLAAAKLLGNSKEQIIGTPRINHFFFTEKRTSPNDILTDQEGLLKKNNGKLIPIIKTIADITLGVHEYFIESFMDISERKYMEEALQVAHYQLERRVEERTIELKKANEKLQKEIRERIKAEEQLLKLYWAVEQSPSAIIITDLNGTIEYVNARFTEITGYKYEDAIGSRPNILRAKENPQELYKNIWSSITQGIEWKGEYINRKKSGELFWVFSSISPIRNASGDITHYLSVQENISERKIFEKELVIAKEKAEQSDKLKSTLLANMSHEFRTPLIGILGFSQILGDIIEGADEKEMMRNIQLSGKRLLHTLNGVLNLSQLEANEIPLNIGNVNLGQHVKSSVNSFIKPAKAKNLKLSLEIRNDRLFSEIDTVLFQQALDNILDNAVKFTNKGSITVELDAKTNSGKYWAVLKIKDTGIGISGENHKIIFEAFRQASEGYNRNFEGSGLGLTIAKKLIEMFGGYITVESKKDMGSVFTILLPATDNNMLNVLVKEDISEIKHAAENKKIIPPQMVNILLVEDNLINQDVIATFLNEEYHLDYAHNGSMALEKVLQNMYDVILMDINLGTGMNGIEVTKRIRQLPGYANVPVIAVTGYALFGDKEKLLSDGLTEYLPKPFDANELIAIINKVLSR